MSDVDIIAALILREAYYKDPITDVKKYVNEKSCTLAAQAIVKAGYRLRDSDLEARVAKLEAWTRGEFV